MQAVTTPVKPVDTLRAPAVPLAANAPVELPLTQLAQVVGGTPRAGW